MWLWIQIEAEGKEELALWEDWWVSPYIRWPIYPQADANYTELLVASNKNQTELLETDKGRRARLRACATRTHSQPRCITGPRRHHHIPCTGKPQLPLDQSPLRKVCVGAGNSSCSPGIVLRPKGNPISQALSTVTQCLAHNRLGNGSCHRGLQHSCHCHGYFPTLHLAKPVRLAPEGGFLILCSRGSSALLCAC